MARVPGCPAHRASPRGLVARDAPPGTPASGTGRLAELLVASTPPTRSPNWVEQAKVQGRELRPPARSGIRGSGNTAVVDRPSAKPKDVTSSYGPWWAIRGRFARAAAADTTADALSRAIAEDPLDVESACGRRMRLPLPRRRPLRSSASSRRRRRTGLGVANAVGYVDPARARGPRIPKRGDFLHESRSKPRSVPLHVCMSGTGGSSGPRVCACRSQSMRALTYATAVLRVAPRAVSAGRRSGSRIFRGLRQSARPWSACIRAPTKSPSPTASSRTAGQLRSFSAQALRDVQQVDDPRTISPADEESPGPVDEHLLREGAPVPRREARRRRRRSSPARYVREGCVSSPR